MNVSELSDSEEVYQLERRLQDTADKLGGMVKDVGHAKQVIEFISDLRKRALAKAMTPYLDDDLSAAAAEAKARASFNYGQDMEALAEQLQEAETVKATWEATKVIWDSARSLLAMQREMSTLS